MKIDSTAFQMTQPRTVGALRLSVCGSGQLDELYQQGASKVLFPRCQQGLQAVLINTSGGVTGGDRLNAHFAARDTAQLTLTTQGCERIYRSRDATPAVIRNKIHITDQARVHWLPQETIMFDGGHLTRCLDVSLPRSADAVIVESLLFGRLAMGETQISGHLDDQITITLDDELVFRDHSRVSGDITEILDRPAVMAGARATALVIYSSHMVSAVLSSVRACLNQTSGASVIHDHLLIARLIAPTGFDLRAMLVPIIQLITKSAPPKTWRL